MWSQEEVEKICMQCVCYRHPVGEEGDGLQWIAQLENASKRCLNTWSSDDRLMSLQMDSKQVGSFFTRFNELEFACNVRFPEFRKYGLKFEDLEYVPKSAVTIMARDYIRVKRKPKWKLFVNESEIRSIGPEDENEKADFRKWPVQVIVRHDRRVSNVDALCQKSLAYEPITISIKLRLVRSNLLGSGGNGGDKSKVGVVGREYDYSIIQDNEMAPCTVTGSIEIPTPELTDAVMMAPREMFDLLIPTRKFIVFWHLVLKLNQGDEFVMRIAFRTTPANFHMTDEASMPKKSLSEMFRLGESQVNVECEQDVSVGNFKLGCSFLTHLYSQMYSESGGYVRVRPPNMDHAIYDRENLAPFRNIVTSVRLLEEGVSKLGVAPTLNALEPNPLERSVPVSTAARVFLLGLGLQATAECLNHICGDPTIPIMVPAIIRKSWCP